MSSNKAAKEALIRLYGNECFIEKLHLRKDDKPKHYTGKAQYKRMKMLTYHHIKMKKDGGRATVENGALLSAENHTWFHQQSIAEQQRMNNAFQEYKRQVDYKKCRVELVDDLELPFEFAAIEVIPDKKTIHVKKLRKEKTKERKEMQKIKKEWEDR